MKSSSFKVFIIIFSITVLGSITYEALSLNKALSFVDLSGSSTKHDKTYLDLVRVTDSCKDLYGLPDPSCTPGSTNPDITPQNIKDTICSSSWSTKSVRPPVSYTTPLKIQQMKEYGYSDTDPKNYEEDHLIPLTIGGNPKDPKNLWPESLSEEVGKEKLGFHEKDRVEVWLNKQICLGKMGLREAQGMIAHDWESVYHIMIQSKSSPNLGVNESID